MRIGTLLLALACVLCVSTADAVAREGHWEVTSAPGTYSGTPTDFNCLGTDGTCWTRYKWVEAASGAVTTGIYMDGEAGVGRGFAGTDIQERMDDDGTIHYSLGDGGIEVGSEDELRQVIWDLAGSSGE